MKKEVKGTISNASVQVEDSKSFKIPTPRTIPRPTTAEVKIWTLRPIPAPKLIKTPMSPKNSDKYTCKNVGTASATILWKAFLKKS